MRPLHVAGLFTLLAMPLPSTAQTAPTAPSAAAQPAADEALIDLLEFQVEGNTTLPAAAIERTLAPFLGPRRRVADIQAARAALERAYHDAGFLTVAVDVPVQRVDSAGIVRLQVVEGRVERLAVSGARHTLPSEVRATATEVREGAVPSFPQLQRQLAQLSGTPDRSVTPLLRPGTAPGTLEVELSVEDRLPLHGSLAASSKRSPSTEAGRIEAFIRYDNLFQRRHSFGLGYIVSPRRVDDTQVLIANYGFPLQAQGATLALSWTRSNSDLPTTAAGGGNVIGRGDVIGLRLGQPLPGREGLFHFVSLGADYKDFVENQRLLGEDFPLPITYLPFSIGYTALLGQPAPWRLNGGLVFASASILRRDLSQPCDVVAVDGASFRLVTDQFACRRAGASGSFAYLRLGTERTFDLSGWRLLVAADAQLAGEPLVTYEQFTLGGIDSVRGYLEAEASGDRGWRLRLQGSTRPLAAAARLLPGSEARLLAFLDGGSVHLVDALPQERREVSLAGTGIGLEAAFRNWLRLSLGYALPLKDGPTTEKRRGRLYGILSAEF